MRREAVSALLQMGSSLEVQPFDDVCLFVRWTEDFFCRVYLTFSDEEAGEPPLSSAHSDTGWQLAMSRISSARIRACNLRWLSKHEGSHLTKTKTCSLKNDNCKITLLTKTLFAMSTSKIQKHRRENIYLYRGMLLYVNTSVLMQCHQQVILEQE